MQPKKSILFSATVLFFLQASAQERYQATPWGVEQGISTNYTTCMLKDGNGFLWIGTSFGLNRFDGSRFVPYFSDVKKSNTLSGDFILSMVEDSLHNLWMGTNKGLCRYDAKADTFTRFASPVKEAVMTPYTLPFWATRDAIYCIEMRSRITCFDVRSFKRKVIVEKFQNNWDDQLFRPASSILDAQANVVWLLGKDALLEVSLQNGRQTAYRFPCRRNVKFDGYGHSFQGMCYDAKRHTIWLNTSDGLVQFLIDKKQFEFHREFDAIVNKKPEKRGADYYPRSGMGIDKKGRIWMGVGPEGTLIYDPVKHTITKAGTSNIQLSTRGGTTPVLYDHLSDYLQQLSPAYFDRDGIIWLNGGKTALTQLNEIRPAMRNYTADPAKPSSLSNNWVATIVEGPQNKLWIGTWDGISIFDPQTETFQVLREKDLPGFKGRNIMPLAMDSTLTTTWLKAWSPEALFEMDIASRRCRKIRFEDSAAAHEFYDNGSMGAETARPYQNGFIFVLNGFGVFQVKKGSLTARPLLKIPYLIGRMAIVEDSLIFLKTPFASTNFTYAKRNGNWMLRPSPLDSLSWSNLFYDKKDQSFWVGNLREILHYDHRFHLIRRYADGFPGISVLSFLKDNFGNIWFVNDKSQISRLNPATGKYLTLSEKDGMQRLNFAWENGHSKDAYGNLYFGGTTEGLHRVSPATFSDAFPPSSVYLQNIAVSHQPLQLTESPNEVQKLSLNFRQNTLHIEASVIDYYSESNSRIRYKLEPSESDWQYASFPFVINLNGLQPGHYRLVMQASNAADVFNGPEKSLSIRIYPPWWSAWWLRIMALLCIAALLYALIRWRLHKKFRLRLEHSEKEKQLAELRQQKTELEMQALRAQMNPHFIFNSLNSINRFILQNNKQEASAYLTKFSRLVRFILQNSQSALIPLESELEALQLYLQLEALRFDQHFTYTIGVDDDLDISALRVPPLIIQPYAENAIWHGLMHKKEKGRLEIVLSLEENELNCTITDNGIGREKAAELEKKSPAHKSMGMRITAERIAMLQHDQQTETYVTIDDLVLADGSAGGTEVTLKIPVHYD